VKRKVAVYLSKQFATIHCLEFPPSLFKIKFKKKKVSGIGSVLMHRSKNLPRLDRQAKVFYTLGIRTVQNYFVEIRS